MKYYLITGTSRGIGEALVKALAEPENYVISFSRSENPHLAPLLEAQGATRQHFAWDLSQPATWLAAFETLMKGLNPDEISEINLIHNAGSLNPIGPIGQPGRLTSISQSLQLNLHAPMLMTDLFVQYTQEWQLNKRVLNISSGAGKRPISGWSTYCTSKAALDMYTRNLALEQQSQPFPILAVALAPGVVDTQMQAQIRDQKAEDFPDLARFLALKAEERLWSPDFVAAQTLSFLNSDSFGAIPIVDLREWA